MGSELVQYESNQLTIPEVMSIGEMMAKSGYFADAEQAAQAVVKIMAGREMGFGPFAAMTGIALIKGKPVVTANLMAAAVKAHPRYDYRIITLTEEMCELAFYQDGRELQPHSTFSKQDAAAAEVGKLVAPGASKNMMARFARNMLFARAMSNGVKWHCPDVFLGAAVYTPDELGATVDADGEIVEGTATVIHDEPPPIEVEAGEQAPATEQAPHWIDKPATRERFDAWLVEKGLSLDDVYRLLNIKDMHQYAGNTIQFKSDISAAIAAEQDAEQPALMGAEDAAG